MAVEIDTDGKRIQVCFPYDATLLGKVKSISGRRYRKDPFPHWTVPLDLAVCRRLRSVFGSQLVIGPTLRQWASSAVEEEGSLRGLSMGTEVVSLPALAAKLPKLHRAIWLGPRGLFMDEAEADAGMEGQGSYQAADVAFLAQADCPLNGNQQGLGKTLELIGAIYEAGIEKGNHLVIAPLAAIDATWPSELAQWQTENADNVGIFPCLGTKATKTKALEAFLASGKETKWLLVNPAMIQYRKTDKRTKVARKAKTKEFMVACKCDRLREPHWHYEPAFQELFETKWDTITIDECHKGSIRNHRSLTASSINDLQLAKGGKRIAMSGTPMKKNGSDLWGILHWLRPDVFTSYWRFAEQFFTITNNGFGTKVGELMPSAEGDFFRMLTPYVLRRTKDECLPWLPPKQYVDVYVTMAGKQLKQYKEMEATGIAAIGDTEGTVSAVNVLAEMTRLRQFANAYSTMKDGKVIPTEESSKLEALVAKLDETGFFDEGSEQKTIIFSQFREMVELVHGMMQSKGVRSEIISGKTNKPGQRQAIKDNFQNGNTQVLCIVTTAGGVSLTLDAADSAHFIDESFAPDDDEQAEDRIHRASRNHNVTIYRYRSRDSIDEAIVETSTEKKGSHERILDLRRHLISEWSK